VKRFGFPIIAVVLAVVLGGCGAGSDRAQRVALAALQTPPPVAHSSNSSSPPPGCTHLTASLRPPTVMPLAGAMPVGSFMARIEHRGYLIAGVDQNTKLLEYLNPLDHPPQFEGFEIDMLRQIARAIFGNPDAIKFVALTTDERISAVQKGTVDIVADAVTITCERKTEVDFSTVYLNAAQRLLVPLNSSIRSIDDLAGRRVCATIGSTTIATVEQMAPRSVPYPVAQRTDCLVALQEGLIDAISSDDAILLGFRAQDPYTKIVGPSISPEPYGIAINKAYSDFVRFVNGVLAEMRADGTWRAIYSHWFGQFSRTPAPPIPQYDG
jgi:polar amino acid transport system substrate-binding protein